MIKKLLSKLFAKEFVGVGGGFIVRKDEVLSIGAVLKENHIIIAFRNAYQDDVVIHCKTEEEVKSVLRDVAKDLGLKVTNKG